MTYVAHKVTRKHKKARRRERTQKNIAIQAERSGSIGIVRAVPFSFRTVHGSTHASDLFMAYHSASKNILAPFKKIDNLTAMRVRNSDRSPEGRRREAEFHQKSRRPNQARKLASVSGRAGRTLERLANLQLTFAQSEPADDLNYALES